MINDVLDQLTYLKLKSSYSYLKELHINDQITPQELKGLYKVLNKEVIAKMRIIDSIMLKLQDSPF